MDKLLLKLMLKIVRLFAGEAIDFEKLKIITETKVMMDRRRRPATWKRKQQKELKNPLLITQIMYLFFGILVGSLIFSTASLAVSMIFIHAYLLFMMAMTLITDFSSVLLDTSDNQVILPRPVNSRTLFLARAIHILTYLLQFTIAIILAPLIFTFIRYGFLVGTGTIITMLLTVAFAVFFTYLLYTLILRFANEQKVRDIIGYFQILMTVFFAVGYQIIPRLIDLDNLHFTLRLHWYSYLLEPVWMALSLEAIDQLGFDSIHVVMIGCAVLIPPAMVWLMMRFLAPSFSSKLAALGNNNEKIAPKKALHSEGGMAERLSGLLGKSQTEKAGFEKVWKITARDKDFKVQFYPGLAYLLVFGFLFIFKNGKNVADTWAHLSATKSFLWFVYLPLMAISSSLNIIPFNTNFTAAWIYQTVPLSKPGEVISGGIKAIIIKFLLPLFFLFFSFSLYKWGPSIIDDFVFGFFNNILIFMIAANLTEHSLPFSREINIKQNAGKLIRVLIQLILIGSLIGLHYLALKIYWLPLALIPFSAVGAYLLLKRIQQLPWTKITV